MKNFYKLLEISPKSNLIEILEGFQKKCMQNPILIPEYTVALNILTNKLQKLVYDANLYSINITTLYEMNDDEIDEYELLPYIEWLIGFKDYFYDTKYYTNNKRYNDYIEKWYDKMDEIIERLKEYVHSIYLI